MNYKVETVNPYNASHSKKKQMVHLFNDIAPVYDKLSDTLSLGIDYYWRSDALKELRKYPHDQILDIATGTANFAIIARKILRPKKITAIDICPHMLEIGQQKVKSKGLQNLITLEKQDCANLTYIDNSFDSAITCFGVRNFENIDKSFQEVLRVLKPGGLFLSLELTKPEKAPMKQLHTIYCRHVIPALARLHSNEGHSCDYLLSSIAAFPQGREMMLILKKNGFTNIRLRRYTLGVVSLYLAEKPFD